MTQATTQQDNKIIELSFKRENGDILLYVKTCRDFEDYLKKSKAITISENFCNTGDAKEFYNERLDTSISVDYDSAVRDVVNNSRINMCILRVKGISNGVNFKIKKLIALNDFELLAKRFILDFKNFYRSYIREFDIQAYLTNKDAF